MLPSYKAIYDHGKLIWTGDAPGVERRRVLVTLIDDPMTSDSSKPVSIDPNGDCLSALLTEMAENGIGDLFGDPLIWQKTVRKDPALPGRE